MDFTFSTLLLVTIFLLKIVAGFYYYVKRWSKQKDILS